MSRALRRALLPALVAALLQGCMLSKDPDYYTVRKGDTLYAIAFRYGVDYVTLARHNNIEPPYMIFVGQQLAIRGEARVSVAPVVRPAEPMAEAGQIDWQWPVRGAVLREFTLDGNPNKGIDIAADLGAPVRAAADGVVVYAGGNLRGYGKLVIIKHGKDYLSAYGNNRSIRVSEGEKVRQGDKISEVGYTESRVALLHFEIRRDGKPLDPSRYLPD